MGLDSVELVMDIENYFHISIPDIEAEKITTIKMMVDCVAAHLNISNHNTDLRELIFQKIKDALLKLQIESSQIKLSDSVSTFISADDKNFFLNLENNIFLKVTETKINTDLTFEKLTDAICMSNYDFLIDENNITSTHQIYIAVSGLTVIKAGIEEYEVELHKSFTDDYRIN